MNFNVLILVAIVSFVLATVSTLIAVLSFKNVRTPRIGFLDPNVGKMVSTIKLWELSNKGKPQALVNEKEDAQKYASYLHSGLAKILLDFARED